MRSLIIVAALAGGVAAVPGCQMSDGHHVDTTNRPANYSFPYVAAKDTEWKSSPDADAVGGTIGKDTTVYFDRSPDSSMTWQRVSMDNGVIRYVRPGDYKMK